MNLHIVPESFTALVKAESLGYELCHIRSQLEGSSTIEHLKPSQQAAESVPERQREQFVKTYRISLSQWVKDETKPLAKLIDLVLGSHITRAAIAPTLEFSAEARSAVQEGKINWYLPAFRALTQALNEAYSGRVMDLAIAVRQTGLSARYIDFGSSVETAIHNVIDYANKSHRAEKMINEAVKLGNRFQNSFHTGELPLIELSDEVSECIKNKCFSLQSPTLEPLRERLAEAFAGRLRELLIIAKGVGISVALVDFYGTSEAVVFNVMAQARHQGKCYAFVEQAIQVANNPSTILKIPNLAKAQTLELSLEAEEVLQSTPINWQNADLDDLLFSLAENVAGRTHELSPIIRELGLSPGQFNLTGRPINIIKHAVFEASHHNKAVQFLKKVIDNFDPSQTY